VIVRNSRKQLCNLQKELVDFFSHLEDVRRHASSIVVVSGGSVERIGLKTTLQHPDALGDSDRLAIDLAHSLLGVHRHYEKCSATGVVPESQRTYSTRTTPVRAESLPR